MKEEITHISSCCREPIMVKKRDRVYIALNVVLKSLAQ